MSQSCHLDFQMKWGIRTEVKAGWGPRWQQMKADNANSCGIHLHSKGESAPGCFLKQLSKFSCAKIIFTKKIFQMTMSVMWGTHCCSKIMDCVWQNWRFTNCCQIVVCLSTMCVSLSYIYGSIMAVQECAFCWSSGGPSAPAIRPSTDTLTRPRQAQVSPLASLFVLLENSLFCLLFSAGHCEERFLVSALIHTVTLAVMPLRTITACTPGIRLLLGELSLH